MDLLNPASAIPKQEKIDYATRPRSLKGLRIGLVENTKKNAEAVLKRIAHRLQSAHGMRVEVIVHKHQRAPLTASQIAELKVKADFAIAGVGD